MHRDIVSHVWMTCTNYLITGSVDGHIKFWKKQPEGIEFVKHFRAHLGMYFIPINVLEFIFSIESY
jgi:peptidylprolyl isomerase domain and WD repeat-containing protein 1